MSRFPDPRVPDPRLDQLRQRTGQQQVPQQSQYPNQDYGAPQQLWPRDDAAEGAYQQQPQPANGYTNGHPAPYGAQQGYGANGNGYSAQDPYASGYGSQPEQAYPYANGGYPQQPASRGLPAPQPAPASAQHLQRPHAQQTNVGFPQQPSQPSAPVQRARQPLAPQQAPAPAYSSYAPPQVQHLPQAQSPATAGRRAPEGAASSYGSVQPRQDAQVGLQAWQQQAPQQMHPATRAPQSAQAPLNTHSPGRGAPTPGAPQARVQQPQSDLYGLQQGFGHAPQGYGSPAATAPQQQSPSAFGGGYLPPQESFQHASWSAADDLSRSASHSPMPVQDFGFEPPLETLGDSFGARDGVGAQAHGSSFDQSYAEDEVEYEEEGGKRSWKKIAFLLGLFIAVGGSLALAYSALLGSPSSTQTASTPPVIKGDERPTKVKPSEPGGKQFSYTDSKMLGRVGEGGAPQAAQGASSGSGDVDPVTGARKVPLLTVGRDGSIQAQQPQQAQEAAPQQATAAPAVPGQSPQTRATVVVPGMTVIDGIGDRSPPTTTASTSPPQQQPAQAQPQPTKIITASEPQKPLVVSPPAKPAGAAPKKTAVAAADVSGSTVAAPATSVTGQPSPSVTGAGYVTVLASVPASGNSRDVAMRQFQDMQQKYGTVLSGKVADVVEANLGEKGTYHRLIAGPPGSKESANQLCNDLKAQGYASCWVTAY